MRRMIWISVVVTAALLMASGFSSWRSAPANGAASALRVAAWSIRAEAIRTQLEVMRLGAVAMGERAWAEIVRDATSGLLSRWALPVAWVAGGLTVALLGALALRRRIQGVRGTIYRLAEHGHPISEIANRVGLAKDAVRMILRPER